MKVDGYSKHTHSLTYTDTRLHIHNPHTHTHPPTHTHLGKRRGERGDSTGIHSIKLEITTLIENKKMEGKKEEAVIALRALDIRIHS